MTYESLTHSKWDCKYHVVFIPHSETPSILRDLDSWIRRRLRCVLLKQWKVYKSRKAELIKLGLNEDLAQITAWSSKGLWKISKTPGMRIALPNKYFDLIGLPRLRPELKS